uniref:glycolipid transfer protein isoform X3 n=1 Tax=Myxine glutinosa TaxID=7769 RepID=UPI00358F8814
MPGTEKQGSRSSTVVGGLESGGTMMLLGGEAFAPVENGEVDMEQFLERVAYILPILDCLGSAISGPIKSDVAGNISKMRSVWERHPEECSTVRAMLEMERQHHPAAWPRACGTVALLWLKRGLRFIQLLLQELVVAGPHLSGQTDAIYQESIDPLREMATRAYNVALRPHHNWLVQQIFKFALITAPSQNGLLQALLRISRQSAQLPCNTEALSAASEVAILDELQHMLPSFTATLDAIDKTYQDMNIDN